MVAAKTGSPASISRASPEENSVLRPNDSALSSAAESAWEFAMMKNFIIMVLLRNPKTARAPRIQILVLLSCSLNAMLKQTLAMEPPAAHMATDAFEFPCHDISFPHPLIREYATNHTAHETIAMIRSLHTYVPHRTEQNTASTIYMELFLLVDKISSDTLQCL